MMGTLSYGFLLQSLSPLALLVLINGVFAMTVRNLEATAVSFASETVLLTDSVLSKLVNLSEVGRYAKLLEFDSANSSSSATNSSGCKVFPGDATWPSVTAWSALNASLEGSLIKTVPSAHGCFNSIYGPYDSAKCSYEASSWNDSYFHAADPTSIDWPLFQGRTCLPTGYNITDTCTIGGYPAYVVNVSTVAQVQLAVNFARNTNIRLIVKNTGHDFIGKSAGAGSLSIWTHHLKDLEFLTNYETPSYVGNAVKAGSGVQAFEFYAFANQQNVTVVGGEGESVGVTGGFIAGGGHSPLSSIYGMAADHVLAIEVVTADGRFVNASETNNPDLFWALRGGGGSTYGVVISVTVKTFPQTPVTVSSFEFTTSSNVSADTFWQGVRAYFDYFIPNADAGTYSYFWVYATGVDEYLFWMRPFFAPNKTIPEFQELADPWFNRLTSLGISFTPETVYYDNFYDAWKNGFVFETVGTVYNREASRLFPRSNFETEASTNATFNAIKNTTTQGLVFLGFNMKNEAPADATNNSVNSWIRQNYLHGITGNTWAENATVDEIKASYDYLTYEIMGQWRAVAPESGAYMSEADFQEPNLQNAFYGDNYDRLYALKQELDPNGLFYAPTGVGAENWTVKSMDGLFNQNGRLCKL